MNVTVDFNDETSVLTEKHHVLVEEVIVKTAEAEGLSGEVEVSVTIVDEKRIQEINREYRDKDQPLMLFPSH